MKAIQNGSFSKNFSMLWIVDGHHLLSTIHPVFKQPRKFVCLKWCTESIEMDKTMLRLFIVTATGISLLFVGMLYSPDIQGLVAFGQNDFGEIAVTLHSQRDNLTTASFDAVGLSPSLLRRLNAQELSVAEWQQIYVVTLIDEKLTTSQQQPMLGAYSIAGGAVRFMPRFPLIPGQVYQAALSFDAMLTLLPTLVDDIPADLQHKTVAAKLGLPSPKMPATEVTAVYPTADQLPENLLRFYVYFSAPMREGSVLKEIQLVDAQGQAVEGVFFDPIFEMWDPSMQRLTLLFDPGRVKTGLRAHEQWGRALTPGKSYTLVIGEGLIDANGNSLARSYEKAFTVTQAALTPPDINKWQVTSPRGGSTDPLTVRFPTPLDHGLLAEFVRIRVADGEMVRGKIELDNHETVWRFTPEEPWQAGAYELVVNTRLEDIAGNNLHGLFDNPPEKKLTFVDRATVNVPFKVE